MPYLQNLDDEAVWVRENAASGDPKITKTFLNSISKATVRRLLIDVANLPIKDLDPDLLDPDSLRQFRDNWPFYVEYNDGELLDLRNDLRMVWTPERYPTVGLGGRLSTNILRQQICQKWLWQVYKGVNSVQWVVIWTKKVRKIFPNSRNLPLLLAWGCAELFGDRLRVCKNPLGCARPRFIATRRDQSYCSAQCAAPAKKNAKLKWWRRNKAKGGKRRVP